MTRAAPYLASPFRRVIAGAIDVVLYLFLMLFFIGFATNSEGSGRLEMPLLGAVAGAVYTLYHVFFYGYLSGATPGQRAWNMSVVRASDGSGLSLARSVVRSGFRPILYYAYGSLVVDLVHLLSPLVREAALLAPVFLELGMMFTLPSRQTLSDLVAKTVVVNVPQPQPHRAPAAPMYSPSDAEFGMRPRRL